MSCSRLHNNQCVFLWACLMHIWLGIAAHDNYAAKILHVWFSFTPTNFLHNIVDGKIVSSIYHVFVRILFIKWTLNDMKIYKSFDLSSFKIHQNRRKYKMFTILATLFCGFHNNVSIQFKKRNTRGCVNHAFL